jgi:hypothetical protein
MEQIISCEADSRWPTQEIEGTKVLLPYSQEPSLDPYV